MKKFLVFSFLLASLWASSTSDCRAIFEQRKIELKKELEKIDEARQANEAIKAANDSLLEKKLKYLKAQQAKNEKLLEQIKKQNALLKEQNKKKQELIASIDDIKKNKLAQTYNKMKDGAAAGILDKMDTKEAASILFVLPPKKVSKILAKMNPDMASEVTLLLQKGPEFFTKKKTKSKK